MPQPADELLDTSGDLICKIFASWIDRWTFTLQAIRERGGETEKLEIGSPASEQEVVLIEQSLGFEIPDSFRSVLLCCSFVSFDWRYEGNFDCQLAGEAAQNIFWGRCGWDLQRLPEINAELRALIPDDLEEWDDYYGCWLGKFAFSETVNGDYLTIDLIDHGVYYLSHDGDGDANGVCLAGNFLEFMDKWTQIGCPGDDFAHFSLFLDKSGESRGLAVDSPDAVSLRKWLGLDQAK